MPSRYVKMKIEDAEELDVIDDVEFKYLKNIIDVEGNEFSITDEYHGDHYIDVTISVEDPQERNRDGLEIMVVTYEFDLGMSMTNPFVISRRFTWLSPYGMQLNKVLCGDDEEEEDEEEPTSVIDL